MIKHVLISAALLAGMSSVAFAQLSPTDKAFVTRLAKANNYELQAAKLAQSMSHKSAYRNFAQMIVTDHTQAGQALAQAVSAADPSMQLPTTVSAGEQSKLDTLKNAGGQFDVKYRAQMISTHESGLALVKSYLQHQNDNPGVRKVAEELKPVFEKHWDYAKKLPKQ